MSEAFDPEKKCFQPWLVLAATICMVSLLLIALRVEHRHTATISERDLVRYCVDRRRAHSPAKEVEYYCREMGGDYYAAQGFTPNYDKYDSRAMFPSPSAP